MNEPLEDSVKREIDQWRKSGVKYHDWIEKNLGKLNEIYCNKETIISDMNTEIKLPIQNLILKDMFLVIEGEKFRKWIYAFDYLFDEKYGMTVTEFHTTQPQNKLRIGFEAYE